MNGTDARLLCVNVVWGRDYLNTMIDLHLPSVLTPWNLPDVSMMRSCEYRIYTTAEGALLLSQSPPVRRLRKLMTVTFEDVAKIARHEMDHAHRYKVMNACHAHAIESLAPDQAVSFLAPDMVWADGSLAHVSKLLDEGKRLVVAPGVRLNREAFRASRAMERGPLGSRDLVAAALPHLHRSSRALVWGGREQNVRPSNVLWKAPRGLLVYGFHLHPVLVWPTNANALPAQSVDGDYVLTAVDDDAAVHVITDSDAHVAFELTPEADRAEFILEGEPTEYFVTLYASHYTNRRHREFVRQPIRLHAGDVSPEWQPIEEEAEATMKRILGALS